MVNKFKLLDIINRLRIPNVILRYIMMIFLDLLTINNLLLTVKKMNVLDDYSKDLIVKANNGFQWNCENGHLTVAKWLYSIDVVNIYAYEEGAFRWSCRNGHLTVAQWLYSLGEGMDRIDPSSLARTGQGNVNIHAIDEYAFRFSCRKGHLTVAQWLYSLGNVNIHADDEYAFCLSCEYNHLTVAQWLYSLGEVNIHAHNEHAFTCSFGNILDWLNNLP